MAVVNPFSEYCTTVLGTPRHWYKFDGALSTSQPDTGDGSTASFSGSTGTFVTQVTGALARDASSLALQFVSGYLDRPASFSSDDFNSTTSGTISVLIKSSSNTNQVFYGGHPSNAAFRIWLLANGSFQLQIINAANSISFTTGQVGYADGAFHMLDVVCDGVNANKIYVDGVEQSLAIVKAGTITTAAWLADAITGSGGAGVPFRVGNDTRAPTTDDFPFIGVLDELQHWEGALTPLQIKQKYLASKAYVADVFLYREQTFANPNDVRLVPLTTAQGELSGYVLRWTEDDDVTAITASATSGTNASTLAWTEDNDVAAITAAVSAAATIAWTEDNDVAALTGTASDAGSLAWTEDNDTAALTGTLSDAGTIAWTETDDTTAITGFAGNGASVAWTEQNDTTAITVALSDGITLAWTETDDTTAIVVEQPVQGALAWTEDDDIAALTGTSEGGARIRGGWRWLLPMRRPGDGRDDEDEAAAAMAASKAAQAELRRAERLAAQMRVAVRESEATRDRMQAELDARIERETVSLRQRRIAKQRMQAAKLEAKRLRLELERIEQEHAALLVEIEEIDVIFVAAVLLAA